MLTKATISKKAGFLVKVMRADGVFATLSGVISIIAARPVAELIELDAPLALVVLGVVLLGYGAMLLFAAGREAEIVPVARIAVVLNLLWVLGSYAGLFLDLFPVNTAGKWTIALIAEAVFLFGLLEYIGLRRLARKAS